MARSEPLGGTWVPYTTEGRNHTEIKPGDRILESWGVAVVESVTLLPSGRYLYRYEGHPTYGPAPEMDVHPSNWPTVVLSGGYT